MTVGSLLRTARQRSGQELTDVAVMLRIRQPYLEAIEQNRYADLPGSTYAVGFVRAYAEHLGLDAKEVVRRFKYETANDFSGRKELHFPSPVSEGRVPGGAILFLGLVMAGIAYGGWHFMSTQERSLAELVPDLPDRLTALIDRSKDVQENDVKQLAAAESEAAAMGSAGSVGEEETAELAEAETAAEPEGDNASAVQAVAESEPEAPAAQAQTETVQAEAATPEAAPAQVTQPAPVQAAPAQPAPSQPTVAEAAAPPAPPQEQVAAVASAPPAPRPADLPAVPSVEPVAEEARVWGEQNRDSRIQLVATEEAWVQVRDDKGQLLLTRLLKSGDTYMVPDRPGLTLMTGNAGGLKITLDGQDLPTLGARGAVLRDVSLDPEKLRSRF
nr:helix-turn-helix domain-containing protein [Telmatospirillum sp. J64-1]